MGAGLEKTFATTEVAAATGSDGNAVKKDASGNTENEVQPESKKGKSLAADPTLTVRFVLHYRGTDGEWTTRNISRTVKSGGSTSNLTAANVSAYAKNVTVGGVMYEYTKTCKDKDDNEVTFPLSFTYEQVQEMIESETTVDYDLYAQYKEVKPSINNTVSVKGVLHANGSVTESSTTNNIGRGGSWGIGKKRLESASGITSTGNKQFTYCGVRYTFTGEWMDEDGNPVDLTSNISLYYKDGEDTAKQKYLSEDTEIVFYPVYTEKLIKGLDYEYIDNISTGSGSWSNLGRSDISYRSDFSKLTHTFSDPSEKTPVAHYRFVNWKNSEDGKTYDAGDSFTYSVNSGLPEGTVTHVTMYAMWQPSVTVNYHNFNGGETVYSTESFESVRVYDDEDVPKVDDPNIRFEGWYDSEGNRLDEDTVYNAPEVTKDNGTAIVKDVYARYVTDVSVEKKWDDKDDKDGIRPDSVSVQLKGSTESQEADQPAVKDDISPKAADGESFDAGNPVDLKQSDNEEESWKYTWKDVDAFRGDQLIKYTVEEINVPEGYEASVEETEDSHSFVITNTHKPADPVKPDDNGNKNGKDEKTDNPETGDQNPAVWLITLFSSVLLLTIIGVRRLRDGKECSK